MGARPMARLIQDTIRKALADELLFGQLVGGGKVTIDIDDDEQGASSCSRKRRRRPKQRRDQNTPRQRADVWSQASRKLR